MLELEAIKKRRTVRKFKNTPADEKLLLEIIDCTRLAPYPANVQPLKFMIVTEKAGSLFKYTKWAGYLEDGAPADGERPPSYIVTLGDKSIKKTGDFYTEGAIAGAVMSIAAEALGIGTCWLGAIDRDGIKKELCLPENLEVVYLLAAGIPAQKSKAVEITDSIKYYIDENNELCVPKRSMKEVLYSTLPLERG